MDNRQRAINQVRSPTFHFFFRPGSARADNPLRRFKPSQRCADAEVWRLRSKANDGRVHKLRVAVTVKVGPAQAVRGRDGRHRPERPLRVEGLSRLGPPEGAAVLAVFEREIRSQSNPVPQAAFSKERCQADVAACLRCDGAPPPRRVLIPLDNILFRAERQDFRLSVTIHVGDG